MVASREKELEKALKGLVESVRVYLIGLDAEMNKPSSPEHGGQIAKLSNALEMTKDLVRFGALGIDFRTGKKRKPPGPTSR